LYVDPVTRLGPQHGSLPEDALEDFSAAILYTALPLFPVKITVRPLVAKEESRGFPLFYQPPSCPQADCTHAEDA